LQLKKKSKITIKKQMTQNIEKLNKVLTFVKDTFVGKNDVVDLLGICLLARENAFLYGPPGTAKSAIVRTLAKTVKDGKNFEYLLEEKKPNIFLRSCSWERATFFPKTKH